MGFLYVKSNYFGPPDRKINLAGPWILVLPLVLKGLPMSRKLIASKYLGPNSFERFLDQGNAV